MGKQSSKSSNTTNQVSDIAHKLGETCREGWTHGLSPSSMSDGSASPLCQRADKQPRRRISFDVRADPPQNRYRIDWSKKFGWAALIVGDFRETTDVIRTISLSLLFCV